LTQVPDHHGRAGKASCRFTEQADGWVWHEVTSDLLSTHYQPLLSVAKLGEEEKEQHQRTTKN